MHASTRAELFAAVSVDATLCIASDSCLISIIDTLAAVVLSVAELAVDEED